MTDQTLDPLDGPGAAWLDGYPRHSGLECPDQLKCPVCRARLGATVTTEDR